MDGLDLNRLRNEAKEQTGAEQVKQKEDKQRFKALQYAVEDVVMISMTPPATGQRNKLSPKAKGDRQNPEIGFIQCSRIIYGMLKDFLLVYYHTVGVVDSQVELLIILNKIIIFN